MTNIFVRFTVSVSEDKYHSSYRSKTATSEMDLEAPFEALAEMDSGNLLSSLLPVAVAKFNNLPEEEEEQED